LAVCRIAQFQVCAVRTPSALFGTGNMCYCTLEIMRTIVALKPEFLPVPNSHISRCLIVVLGGVPVGRAWVAGE